jgi:hypothetical protein
MLSDPRGIRPRTLVVVALVAGGLGWAFLRLLMVWGVGLPIVGWMSAVILLFTAAAVVAAGIPVKRLQAGKPGLKPVGMLRAARTVVLAQAAALTGSAVVGWYAAQALLLVADLDIPSVREHLWPVLATCAAGVVLAVAGMITQRWCRIDESDPDHRGPGGASAPA